MVIENRYVRTEFDADIDNTVTLLLNGPGNFRGFHLENPNSSDIYLQVFNARKTTDVTLGTTAPVLVFEIIAGGSRDESPETGVDEHFSTGICYAITTTSNGSSDPTSGAKGFFKYKKLGY